MEPIREILFKPAWYWLITITPTALTYIGVIPENKRSGFMNQFYNLFPFWVWLTIALIAFVVTILISTNNYVKTKLKDTSQHTSLVGSQVSGRDSYASGRDTIIHPPSETTPPNIFVGISQKNSISFDKWMLHLKPLPSKPDVEQIIERERTRLLNKPRTSEIDLDSVRVMYQFDDGKYPVRVEEYLEKYKNYEIENYRMAIIDDRWRTLDIVVESRSLSSASNVVVRLYFPDFIHFPSQEINVLREMYTASDGKFRPSRPSDPPLFEIPSIQMSWEENALMNINHHMPYMEIDRSNEYRIIKADSGNIVEYRIKDLLQNHLYIDLDPIDIWLDNIEHSINFIVPIEINAKELPEKTKRLIEVNIVVEGKNE